MPDGHNGHLVNLSLGCILYLYKRKDVITLIADINQIHEINEFINLVFNFYNGKINTFNRAVLNIDWSGQMDNDNAGTTSNPNLVYIFPAVILRHFPDMYWAKYNLLTCIIHELHHVDQFINYTRMRTDYKYKEEIEAVVEMETYLYIANHQHEIENRFGIRDLVPRDQYYSLLSQQGFETGKLFHRRTYLSHMISIIYDLVITSPETLNRLINEFSLVFNHPDSTILVKINNSIEFVLKNKLECMPISQLNDILTQYYFRFNLRGSVVRFIRLDGTTFEFIIQTDCVNTLYRLVRKEREREE